MAVVLETVGLTRYFGRVAAVDDVSVGIEAGAMVGIVGPNGAGKTTFLNLITGYVKPEKGQILHLGTDITGLPPRVVTGLGIARSFQIPQLYTSLSVRENLLIALATRAGHSLDFWSPLKRDVWIAEALDILDQFGLGDYAHRPVSELPEGGRKLLDIALSFALKPRLLLMDEPTSGVSMKDKFGVMDTLVEVLRRTGVTTVFVEHDMEVVHRYAQRVLVFSGGRIAADGDPETLFADPHVRRAVIGLE
jgi:branched-chain amino acid transport system ATP-binding protein